VNTRRLGLTLLLGLSVMLAFPVPAVASCAAPPMDSPYAFVGTVVEVKKDGRVATVVIDTGDTVVVHGSPELGDHTATSVDRRFALGGRYEFHPINATSPYQDNACTATRQLAGPTPTPVEPARDRLPGWLPVDEQDGPIGYAALAAMGLVPLTMIVALIMLARRALAQR